MTAYLNEVNTTAFFSKTAEEVKTILCKEKCCPLCPSYRYVGENPLETHVQNTHLHHSVDFTYVDETVICLPCRRPCSNLVMRRVNTPFRSHFHCPFCLKIITRSTSFKRHIVRCTGSVLTHADDTKQELSDGQLNISSVESLEQQDEPMLDIFDVTPRDMKVLKNFVQLFQFNPYVLHSDEMLFIRKWLVDDLGANLPEISDDEYVDDNGTLSSNDEQGASGFGSASHGNKKLQVIVDMDNFVEGTLVVPELKKPSAAVPPEEKIIVTIKSDLNEFSKFMNCTECKKQFQSTNEWKEHMKKDHSINGHEYKCPKCNQKFKDVHCLTRHIRRDSCRGNLFIKRNIRMDGRRKRIVATEIPVKCPTCNLVFKMPHLLKKHAVLEHQNDCPFVCEHCGLTFTHHSACKAHQLTHSDERPYACEHCEKRFKTKQLLTLHTYMHTGEKPFSCAKCDAKFRYRGTLVQHLSTVHNQPKPYLCNVCGKSFCRINVFRYHQHTHTGYRPHKCKHCEKTFFTSNQLRLHQHNHDGKKLFHCKMCSASYCRSSALSKHVVLKHTRNFKHRCISCDKGFVFASLLQKHIDSVHKIDEPTIKTELIDGTTSLFSTA